MTEADGRPALWDAESLAVASDPPRRASYRRLQSWYRHVQLGVHEAGQGASGKVVGSMLPAAAVADQPDLNFLTPSAAWHAERRARAVRLEGGTLEEDRLRRNLLSSMPLCFNIFGSLGTHPAFAELLRTVLGDDGVGRVVDVACEWAPQPRSAYLDDRSAFDAFIEFEHRLGPRCFIGVETKYTEPFSQIEYDKPTHYRVAAESGWFTPGAASALRGKATNQLWRTVLLAAALERDDRYKRGEVMVLSCADDTSAAECVGAVRAHMVEPGRLHHVRYEELVAAAEDDPDLTHWANRFQHRYLNPEGLNAGRQRDERGPALGMQVRWPDRPDQQGAASVSDALMEALSWGIASRLTRRHPELVVVEGHAGGGTYDTLDILPSGPELTVHIALNRGGSGHVFQDGQPIWVWPGIWSELVARTDYSFAVELLEHHAGLAKPSRTPPARPHTIAYRAIAALLHRGLGESRRWRALHATGGETWTGMRPPPWAPEPAWVLFRGDEPIAAFDAEAGRLYRANDSFNLSALYKTSRQISTVVAAACGDY